MRLAVLRFSRGFRILCRTAIVRQRFRGTFPRSHRKTWVFTFLKVSDRTGVVRLRRQRLIYVPVIWRMASWKDRPRTWTWKSMALPARLRAGQRQ